MPGSHCSVPVRLPRESNPPSSGFATFSPTKSRGGEGARLGASCDAVRRRSGEKKRSIGYSCRRDQRVSFADPLTPEFSPLTDIERLLPSRFLRGEKVPKADEGCREID